MSHYDTPTSLVRKAKERFRKRQKAKEVKLPVEDSNNWKLAKFIPSLRKR